MKMTIHEKIFEIRSVLGLSRKKFAELAGLSPTAIYYFERGRRVPSNESLHKILAAFHIDPERFFKEVDINGRGRPHRAAIDAETLRREYLEKHLTAAQIADNMGYSKSSILARMREYKIPRRPKFGHEGPSLPERHPEVVEALCGEDPLALQWLQKLPYREREIIMQRLGIQNRPQRTLEEIGQEFDLTRERIRQIQNKALERIARVMMLPVGS